MCRCPLCSAPVLLSELRPVCLARISPCLEGSGRRVAFRKLGRNKGVGPDEIRGELLEAGADATAAKYGEINRYVASTWQWPTQWQGGDIVNAWKKKGSIHDCDSSRGLLLRLNRA